MGPHYEFTVHTSDRGLSLGRDHLVVTQTFGLKSEKYPFTREILVTPQRLLNDLVSSLSILLECSLIRIFDYIGSQVRRRYDSLAQWSSLNCLTTSTALADIKCDEL